MEKKINNKEGRGQRETCVNPKTYPDERTLIFYKISSFEQIEKQHHGLQEPNPDKATAMQKSQIDLLIVPGLVFNKAGFRIGFGGGYYDRFLVDFPHETLSLLSQSQLINKIPVEHFDKPVEYLIVENKIMKREQV